MSNYSELLTNALESDCTHSMEPLMQAKNKSDFEDMLAILSKNESSQAKARALFALGRWGDSKAVTPICKSLKDLDEIGKLTAADSLSRLNTAGALDGILQLTNDTSPHVRKSVVSALSKFDKPKAIKGIESMAKIEKEDFVLQYAKQAQAKTAKRK